MLSTSSVSVLLLSNVRLAQSIVNGVSLVIVAVFALATAQPGIWL
jgi:hypothetical protein